LDVFLRRGRRCSVRNRGVVPIVKSRPSRELCVYSGATVGGQEWDDSSAVGNVALPRMQVILPQTNESKSKVQFRRLLTTRASRCGRNILTPSLLRFPPILTIP